MSVHTLTRPVAAPADVERLCALVAEPETALADPPMPEPNAGAAVVLGLLLGLLISPATPKEPRK
ncbi:MULTISPECIES: hypothetical protein [Saccharothrix]|uniref:hypothetical protein n=1 Tax=Saccharothrix TaxID=2071 RepID=UPI00093A0623|nr:hypothetical protein [Saccharothrix sp. CB00851]OKI36127.1 hypothetical protein A6A25_22310 [Saccharothrix sp. CB00851]